MKSFNRVWVYMANNVADLCVEATSTILDALKMLDRNALGIVFVVEGGRFVGSLTDGDIRRAMIGGADKVLAVGNICNRNAVWLPAGCDEEEIRKSLSSRIKYIPLLDVNHCVVDFAAYYRMHHIPVLEPLMRGNELKYVTDCIQTNWISSQGAYVTGFEKMIAAECRSENCVAVSNGTVALHLALVTLGVGPGDEVIVPDLTFAASVNAVIHAGATPVLVDVDPVTWNISPAAIRGAVTPSTRAIMPVHLYGVPCDMEAIMAIAREHGLLVVEDCAEALGSSIQGRPVGSYGDAAAFSFFGNKVITCGEGGAILFRDSSMHERALLLRDHGMQKGKRYWHVEVGYNYRLTNLQAAVGCAQMEQLQDFRARRKEIFAQYDRRLRDSGFFTWQLIPDSNESSYWLYTFVLNDGVSIGRDDLIDKLRAVGIDTRPVFYPMHDMPAFRQVKSGTVNCSTSISRRGISLPTSVSLTDLDIDRVCDGLLNYVV